MKFLSKFLLTTKILSIFVVQFKSSLDMKRELNEQEFELLEAIRNFKSSRHNPSPQLEAYALQLFDEIMYDLED